MKWDDSNYRNFDLVEKLKFSNKYNEIYIKANKYIKKKNRINEIYNYIMEITITNQLDKK